MSWKFLFLGKLGWLDLRGQLGWLKECPSSYTSFWVHLGGCFWRLASGSGLSKKEGPSPNVGRQLPSAGDTERRKGEFAFSSLVGAPSSDAGGHENSSLWAEAPDLGRLPLPFSWVPELCPWMEPRSLLQFADGIEWDFLASIII